jgi:U4/U6 small nuclear ribonucleoprotein SNU13
MAEARGKAWPLADEGLTNSVSFLKSSSLMTDFMVSQILDLVQQAGQYKQLKKGANEGEQRLTPFPFPASDVHFHSD